MNSFDGAYASLNARQKQAADTIDGPLLVIAGPGTGKTQLLSVRVANILRRSDNPPNSILCLTFTNKAADNMKKRLIELIGPEANGIFVRTFHSFAAEVMNRYPEYFWSGARLSIAPDALQLEITRQVLKSLPVDHALSLKFAGHFALIKDVQDAINLTKEAGLTPDKLRALIGANLAYIDGIEPKLAPVGAIRVTAKSIDQIAKVISSLPEQNIEKYAQPIKSLSSVLRESFDRALSEAEESGKNNPLSQWKRRWIQPVDGQYKMSNERARNEWWLAVADAYEIYRKKLHLRGYYDYSDMLVEVIGQIEQHPNLRAELQEQFQYVLIDEFQDTNAAQLRMAHLVADHFTSEGRPNLMAVGDDDQSIFKFQGAELSNMLGFSHSYPKAKIIVLSESYRSTQQILDTAGQIIGHSSYRLVNALPGLNKKLVASQNKSKSRVVHFRFRSRPEQLTGMTDEVAKLFGSGQSVAVLARGHNSLRDMADVLTKKVVPIRYEQGNGVFEKPAIQQLMALLRLVVALSSGDKFLASELLSKILIHAMWALPPKSLWEFAISSASKGDWYQALLAHKDKRFQDIGKFINELVAFSVSEPAAIVIEHALGLRPTKSMTSPLKSYYLDARGVSQQYLETLSAVQLLRTLANEFSGNKTASVADFVALADLMEQNSKVLADTSPFVSGERYVELLSVHKAKGLEFDAVAIIDAVDDQWSPSKRGRLPPANLPLRPAEDDTDDYARLMYVAATRARNTLLISSYQQSIKGEEVMSSPIIDGLSTTVVAPQTGQKLIETLETTLAWPRLEQADERRLLRPWLEDYTMSVTHLINFLDVSSGGPQYFFERNILRLPAAKSPAASLGSAIHSALQLAQNLVNQGHFSFSELVKQLESSLRLEGLPHAEFDKQLARGKNILKHLFKELKFKPSKGDKPEYALSDVLCGKAILNGKLDVLSRSEDQIIITDYKTGRPLSSLNAKAGEEGIKAWKHRLQLTYYALLAQLEPHISSEGPILCQMLYVEAKNKKDLLRQYTPAKDEITRLGSLIQSVWRHVMNLDFPSVNSYTPDYQGIAAFEQNLLDGKI